MKADAEGMLQLGRTSYLMRKENTEMDENRIALVGIIVEDLSATEKINLILHDCSEYIVGRMGIPYRRKNVSIISVIMDAPADKISSLSGKLGMIPGVNVKTVYTKGQ